MSCSLLLPPASFALIQFGDADLGDARRTRRAVQLAAAMAANPDASIPRLMGDAHQAKGVYRLFERSDHVTFDALSQPHQQQTRAAASHHRRVLLIGDVTEINYTHHPATRGLEMIGDGKGRGFCLHSMLAVGPQKRVIGLARAELFYRQRVAEGETRAQRLSRDRESQVWARSVRQGPAPAPGQQLIHVVDAAGDDFSFYEACFEKRCEFVNPASQDRRAALGHDAAAEQTGTLKELLRQLPAMGGARFFIQARKPGQTDRWAKLAISFSPVTIFAPWLGKRGAEPLRVYGVRIWEVDAPAGVDEPIEWMLLTSLPVRDLQGAVEVMEIYAARWLIEEYHQCLKSGCAIERKQLEEADRLEALLGIAVVIAARLLALKQEVRQRPETPAVQQVDALSVRVLCMRRKLKRDADQLTLHEFWREVA